MNTTRSGILSFLNPVRGSCQCAMRSHVRPYRTKGVIKVTPPKERSLAPALCFFSSRFFRWFHRHKDIKKVVLSLES